MTQYIDKSALVAEIDKMMAEEMIFYETACKEGDEEVSSSPSPVVYTRLQILRSHIDTLEVKESPTDAFIEKACEYMRNHIDQQLTIYHEQTWKKRDEFIEDFKNYMEGK